MEKRSFRQTFDKLLALLLLGHEQAPSSQIPSEICPNDVLPKGVRKTIHLRNEAKATAACDQRAQPTTKGFLHGR